MVREGTVGLLLLAGLGILVVGVSWVKGLNPANRSFTVTVNFPEIAGVQVGSTVRYRGVPVGQIVSVKPGSNRVDVKISISPADLLIPANAQVSIDQSGLLGETVLNINTLSQLKTPIATQPLDPNCDRSIILCQGAMVKGELGITTDALVRSSTKFAELYSNQEFFDRLLTLTTNSGKAAAEIAAMSREFTALAKAARQQVGILSSTVESIGGTAQQIGVVANRGSYTLEQVNSLLATNRGTLVSTLHNINRASESLRLASGKLEPVLDQFDFGQFMTNLDTLSANAAQASVNLRDLSQTLNSPTNLVILQQTLDSARATFQNAQKITADLDDLTGDPALRHNFKMLINGLSGLVSSTQTLQQQTQYALVLEPLAQQANAEPSQPVSAAPQPSPLPSPLPSALLTPTLDPSLARISAIPANGIFSPVDAAVSPLWSVPKSPGGPHQYRDE
jgi:phospholipid/cholesterol/gamma-HCH transport system substrate-binding protein